MIFCDFIDNDRLFSSAQCVFCLKEGNSIFLKRQFLWGADNICMSWVVRPARQLIVLAKEERSKLVTPRISGQEGRQLGNLPSIRISCPASCPLRQGGLAEARIMILFSVSSYPPALASSPKINNRFQGGNVWGSSAKGTNLLKLWTKWTSGARWTRREQFNKEGVFLFRGEGGLTSYWKKIQFFTDMFGPRGERKQRKI